MRPRGPSPGDVPGEGAGLAVRVALPFAVLVLSWLLFSVVVRVCKQRLGIKCSAPGWQLLARLFPATFPRLVACCWSCVGCIPCGVPIALHGYCTRWSRKAVWTFAQQPGSEGKVALTIDDAPAREGGTPMMYEVLEVLTEFHATCSFFVVSTFCEGREDMLHEAVRRGHELCNHGGKDIPYHRHSKEDFHKVLLDCERTVNATLHTVNTESPPANGAVNRRNNKWFRPPHAKMSAEMEEVLDGQGFRIAMSDCYAMDVMCRPPFIADFTASHARHGSIVLLHMPEVGFREYNLESLRNLLAGLKARGIQCVSLSQMEQCCKTASYARELGSKGR